RKAFGEVAARPTGGESDRSTVDRHTVAGDVVSTSEGADAGLGTPLQLEVTRDPAPLSVKVDVPQLRKALSYLVWYLTHNSPAEHARVSVSVGRHTEKGVSDNVQIFIGSRTATVAPDKLHRLFDPVQMVQESLIDVGPAVSQRLVEALGGDHRVRQARNELAFVVSLPVAGA